jgi:cytochrome b involved in lipid metabolism
MKLNLIILGLSILLLIGCTVNEVAIEEIQEQQEDSSAIEVVDEDESEKVENIEIIQETVTTINMEELKKHNTNEDCWVVYDKIVYDVTDFLNVHPGGEQAISRYCGTSEDFEQAFHAKHSLTKVGVLQDQGVNVGQFE